ncbi:family 78 glycoside hydrolase catalytic domain [Terriglobus saanensis]|uniref:alpha-L-rhamnosidase n=1 Tax=Terriglobus saanensis (strain ATCC BAA-1853 / DSM 23119 / SP1PR4) TaxID=401053 RepID=E8V4R1_TERSS|nr:family 78 glycoside hydrolase catalytic domain [Terriglobus saanensis]ADV81465.1 alpha-L-rhamnosidase [Terriglobus saanensis SP1PR4]
MGKWYRSAVMFGVTLLSAVGQDVAPTHLVEQTPVAIRKIAPGVFLVDFGRVAFGNLSLTPVHSTVSKAVEVRFGEALKDGRVDTHPPGSVRYAEVKVATHQATTMIVAPPVDARNTTAPAVLTPPSWGVLMPFRWVEVLGWPRELRADEISRRAVFDSTWVDDAATFHSSDPMLDRVWDLCHYSIKATTFAGVFVDGDRERLAYEADAYLTQLSYYAGDADPRMARATFERLMKFPTWPSEWAPQMIFMAYADWMQTGDTVWLAAHYEELKTKLLEERVSTDGLVMSTPQLISHADIVDWPIHERDGYVFTSVNTVVNAFHLRALEEMSQLAEAQGKAKEAAKFLEQKRTAQSTFQEKLFDPVQGLYRDGVGTEHASLHANLFPLAFGLVPSNERPKVAQWLVARGMAGSVYAAQYLLEALFENGEDADALALITAPGDRSWRHMVDSDATITWEAWDLKYKPNQDTNHAWGAAPANLLPRFVLGARPLTPGWGRALIQPHPGTLTSAEGRMPTPHGEMSVRWKRDKHFTLALTLPSGMTAKVELPALEGSSEVRVGGTPMKAHREGRWWILEKDLSGSVMIEER